MKDWLNCRNNDQTTAYSLSADHLELIAGANL
jgi:hypothetical protein